MEMSYSPKMGYEAFLRNRKKENQAQMDNQTQQKNRTENSQSNVLNRENLKSVSAQAQLYNSRLFQDAARLDQTAKQEKAEIEQKQQAKQKTSSPLKNNGFTLPRSEVIDRATQARIQKQAQESAAYVKKKLEEQQAYDNMSLAEVDSRLEQLAQERAAFVKENGGTFKNRLMKFATTIDPNAWDYVEQYKENLEYLDENQAETEKLESMRLKKAQQEKLSVLPQETLELLDEYNEAENKGEETNGENFAAALNGGSAAIFAAELSGGNGNATEDLEANEQGKKAFSALKSQGYDDETIQELAYLRQTQQEEKEAQKLIDERRALAEQSTAAGFVVPRAMNLPAAMVGLYDNATQFLENKAKGIDYGLNPDSVANALTKSNTAMDEANMEKRDWNVDVPVLGETDLYDMFYKAAASGTDSAVRSIVGGGSTGASVLLAGEALNQGFIEGKEKGYSDEKAITNGVIQGLTAGATEKYGLGSILKEPKSIVGSIVKDFAVEGAEGAASNWLDRATDAIINGNNSEIKQAYNALIEQGVPHDEALSQIMEDLLEEDAQSFVTEGLSGAGSRAASQTAGAVTQKINGYPLQRQIGENILENGNAQALAKAILETEDFQDNKSLQNSAEKILQAENGQPNANQVGRVYQLAMEMASKADAKQQAENLDNALSQRLSELGTSNPKEVAPLLAKVIRGGTLTQSEAKTADTKAGRQVVSEYFTPKQNAWVSKMQTKTSGQSLAALLNRQQPITREEAQRPVVAIAHTTEEGKSKKIDGTISEFAPRKLTVKAIRPSGIQFETENGQIVNDSQLIFKTDSAANLYRRATENGNVLFANLAIAAYDGSVGVDQYMTAAQRFYEAGRNGQSFSKVRKTNIVGQYLSESMARQFYNLGANMANM